MNDIRRAALFSSADRYATLALNFFTVIAISRLLTPEETGVMAIGAAILAVSEVIRDVITGYLIQKERVDDDDVRSSFTVMMSLTLLLSACLLVLGDPIAHFAHDGRIADLLQLIAIGLLAGPFERPLLALMRREMNFWGIALISVITVFVNASVMIVLAAAGWGAMSYGWAVIVSAIAAVLAANYLRPHDAILRFRTKDWRGILQFAKYNNTAAILLQIHEMLPSLLLARFLSVEVVGAYNRAYTVSQLPTKTILSAVGPIVLPALARQAREGSDLLKSMLHMIELLAAVQWPALIVLALLAHPIAAILLGPQWMHIVPIIQIMALASLPSIFSASCYPLLVAAGGIRHMLISVSYFLPFSFAITVVAASYGLIAFVSSLFLINLIQAVLYLWAVRHYIAFRSMDVIIACARSLPPVAGSIAGVMLVAWPISGGLDMSIPEGILAAASGIAGWLAGLKFSSHCLWVEVEHIAGSISRSTMAQNLKKRGKSLTSQRNTAP